MRLIRTVICVLCCSTIGHAADPLLSEIRLRTDPEDARVRPFETLVVQVLAYGDLTDEDGLKKKVRLRKGAANLVVKGSDPGWLSKPFRYQGKEDESFYQQAGAGLGAVILARISDLAPLTARVYTLTRRSATISPPERGGG